MLTEYNQNISNLVLIPSGFWCFELSSNVELLYSKLKTGQFPDEQYIVSMLCNRLSKK